MGVACGSPKAGKEWSAGDGTDVYLADGQVAVAFHAEVRSTPLITVKGGLEDACRMSTSSAHGGCEELQESTVSWQSGSLSFTQWRDLPRGLMLQAEQALVLFQCGESASTKRCVVESGGLRFSIDFTAMTCKEVKADEISVVRPLRRLARCTNSDWKVTHPLPSKPHPLRMLRVSRKDDGAGWLSNDFFWHCFREVLQKGGYQVDITSADRMFDFANNQDFRSWKPHTKKMSRGGVEYEVPKGWKRFAVRVAGRFDDGDNKWMSLDGREGEWAVAYHGTSRDALAPIVSTGLKAGSRQAFSAEVGRGIYCTPSLDVAKSYSSQVQHNGRCVRFVIQCRVRPEAIKRCSRSEYWVINKSEDIRPYGVLVQQC